ncbi:hypothetical protein MFIFM68171_07416 [Madurella fahalii]|uniref:Uncharacterized protein n=1 Tax=Madurella fahalii TaxID=1157608 RepID=A0ABQ0GHG7_9PEZI
MSAQDYYNQAQGYGYSNSGQQSYDPNQAPPPNYYQQQVCSAQRRLQTQGPPLTVTRNTSHTVAFRRGIRHMHLLPSSSKAHITFPKPRAMHRGNITSHSIMDITAVSPCLGQLLRRKPDPANRRASPLARVTVALWQRLRESLAASLVQRQNMVSG